MNKKMNKLALGLLVATIMSTSVISVPTYAAVEPTITKEDSSIISVNGKGTIKVKPDIAFVNIGYESRNKVAAEAQKETRTKMDAILKALKAAGIKDADMKTLNISLYKTSDYSKDQKVEYYYVANQSLEVTIRDLEKAGNLIDAATTAGSNQVGSIRFTVENQEQYYNQALVLALKNASSKAEVLLGVYGYKLNKPFRINEASYNGGIVYRDAAVFSEKAMAMPSTPVQIGTIEITADVSVEYKF